MTETKKITVDTEAVLSVGGAYYKSYTIEDKDYEIGEIIKATITDHRGGDEKSYEVDLEVNESLLEAIKREREYLKREEYFQSLKANRPTLNLYRLTDDINCIRSFSLRVYMRR